MAGPRSVSKPDLHSDSSAQSDISTTVEAPGQLVGASAVQNVGPPAKSSQMYPGLPLKKKQWHYRYKSVIYL